MYSVSSAAHVLQWTFDADGAGWSSRRCFAVGERGASQLCIDASGARIASAHSGIDLWDVASGAKVCSFTGHADVVRCLEFSLDGKFIVSGAEDRFLSVWAVSASVLSANANAGSLHSTDSKSKKKKKGGKKRKHAETVGAPLIKVAARTLVAQAQPLAVAMRSSGKSGAAGYRLLAVTADGNGLVWDLADVGAQKSGAERLPRPPSTADCRVSVAAPGRGALAKGHAAASAAIISAVFASANARTIVVAQGRAMDPSFATKSIVGEGAASSSVLSRVLIASVSAKGRNAAPAGSAAAKGISAANGKNLVGPMGAATRDVHLEQRAAKRLRVSGESKAASTGEFGSVRDYLQASASGSGSGAAAAAEEEEEEEGEQNDADVVLGDRVEALSQELSVDITQQREDEALALATPQSDALAPPPSLSMSAVLDQALQSGDNAMLEYCLAVQTQPIVESTVDRLSPQRAVQFIDRIVYKFERNPNRSLSLSVWIHAVLRRHAAYLMTVPDLVARLRPIYQVRACCTRLGHECGECMCCCCVQLWCGDDPARSLTLPSLPLPLPLFLFSAD